MKKLLVLTILVGFFTGCNKHVEPSMSTKEALKYPKNKHTFVSAIQKAA
ncbi:hypothetical protein [Sulfurovum sp.]|nr:hypothetical protein [Sulfurovum sp.]